MAKLDSMLEGLHGCTEAEGDQAGVVGKGGGADEIRKGGGASEKDVGAKEEIYKLIDGLARQGVAILFASSDMEEIIGLADRAFVMHEGRIAGEVGRADLSEEAVMRLATGDAESNARLSVGAGSAS